LDIKAIFNIYGVRGSLPISHKDYLSFGGNTSSYTLRTPDNTLIFLDAGTGIQFANSELVTQANNVWLLISHTHADHLYGFGMSFLPWLNKQQQYLGKKLQMVGPKGLEKAFQTFFDGLIIWPVIFSDLITKVPNMPGIDYANILEIEDFSQTIKIDSSTTINVLKGNHPVEGGIILYRFEIQYKDPEMGNKILIYATDNEFDYLTIGKPNRSAPIFKQRYIKFINNADLLIADGQYSYEDYNTKKGYGHSYPEQILDLANEANVKLVVITHHGNYTDNELLQRERKAKTYVISKQYNLKVEFAREGNKYNL